VTDPNEKPVTVADPERSLSPVAVRADEAVATPTTGRALCLSGGGSRAMLFHAGALLRLNQAGLLKDLDCISSVSGGSIAAGALAVAWKDLEWGGTDGKVAQNLAATVVKPLQELARHRIDVLTYLIGTILPGQTPATRFANVLDEHLLHGMTLDQLEPHPGAPLFVFNATNLATGDLWKFSREEMSDYRVGKVLAPQGVRVAIAVAASSAFPPAYAPLWFDLSGFAVVKATGDTALEDDAFRKRVPLADGGAYDNLGMETAWKANRFVLVSDGGGESKPDPKPTLDPVRQIFRVMKVIDRQVRSLRKRTLVAGYKTQLRDGAYWGIRTQVADYKLDPAPTLPCPPALTDLLAAEPTRLTKMPVLTQQRLINWGYAVSDAAIRAHVLPGTPIGKFPYPNAGVG
jgi:NTE family protein